MEIVFESVLPCCFKLQHSNTFPFIYLFIILSYYLFILSYIVINSVPLLLLCKSLHVEVHVMKYPCSVLSMHTRFLKLPKNTKLPNLISIIEAFSKEHCIDEIQ